MRTRPACFPASLSGVCACAVLTGTTGLQIDGGGVTRVEEGHGGGGGEGVDPVQKGLVVQVVEGAVRLPRLVRRSEQHRPADEFILNRASSQTSTLRLDLMNRYMREGRGGEGTGTRTRIVVSVEGGIRNRISNVKREEAGKCVPCA